MLIDMTMGDLTGSDGLAAAMRTELLRGDRVLNARGVVLRQLIATDDHSMFSDAIVTRVRAMAHDLGRQLAIALAHAANQADPAQWAAQIGEPLAGAVMDEPQVLDHLHAVALEWQLTESLRRRSGLDPALSPLLQALIGADDPTSSALAMDLLSAQAAFTRQQERMALPLGELPPEVLHALLTMTRQATAGDPSFEGHARKAVSDIRARYEEGRSRIAVANHLVGSLGAGAFAALAIAHAGVAIWLSALASATGETRDTIIGATGESQLARLALSLRAAGLGEREIEREFFLIHPDITLPEGFGALRGGEARSLLSGNGAPRIEARGGLSQNSPDGEGHEPV